MSQASVHEQAYHLLSTTSLTYQQIATQLSTTLKVVWRVANTRLSDEDRKARKVKNYRRAQLGKYNTMYNRKKTGGLQVHVGIQAKSMYITWCFAREKV